MEVFHPTPCHKAGGLQTRREEFGRERRSYMGGFTWMQLKVYARLRQGKDDKHLWQDRAVRVSN
jgi:hypothetical protein